MSNEFKIASKLVVTSLHPMTLPKLASDPNSGMATGDMYYNTTLGMIKYYDGSAWQQIATGVISLTGQALNNNNLIVGASNNHSAAVDTSSVGHILADSTNGLTIKSSVISNSHIASNAAIARSKIASGSANTLVYNDGSGNLADLTAIAANRALISDNSGLPSASSVTATELAYVSGVTSAIQTQFSGKAATDLSNLSSTAINASLIPGSDNSLDFGSVSSVKRWKDMYLSSSVTIANGSGAALVKLNSSGVSRQDVGSSLLFATANGGSSNSGDIIVQSGSSTGTRGKISLDGSYVDVNSKQIKNLADGVDATDAVTMQQLSASLGSAMTFTASRAIVSNSSGVLSASSVTSTEIGYLSGVSSAIQTQLNAKVESSLIGSANGIVPLDSSGKIDAAYLPNSVMEFKGAWNATSNSPSLADGTGNAGDVYRVSTAGSQTFGSVTASYGVGDWIMYNGSVWQHSPATDAVTSVNSKTGAVTLTTSDIAEGTNLYYTSVRAQAVVDASLAALTTDSVTEGSTNLYFTANRAKDAVGAALTDSSKIAFTYASHAISATIVSGSIVNADINASAAIDASKIANGSVSNTEFQYLDGVTSAIQTQLDGKATKALDNLASTAVNVDLLPDADASRDLGGVGKAWDVAHISSQINLGTSIVAPEYISSAGTFDLIATQTNIVSGSASNALISKVYTLAASVSTDTDIAAVIDLTVNKSVSIEYECVEASTGEVRNGTIKIASKADGTNGFNDMWADTGTIGTGIVFGTRYDSGTSSIFLTFSGTSSHTVSMKMFMIKPN